MHKVKLFITSLILLFVMAGCGAVPIDDRYAAHGSNSSENQATKGTAVQKPGPRGFDFGIYSTKPSFMRQDSVPAQAANAWYRFPAVAANGSYEKTNGYRIQVLSTDNYNEALRMQDSVKSCLSTQKTYIDFEAPFYKVKIGDLTDPGYAADLQFKLRQLGFKSPLITQDSILVKER